VPASHRDRARSLPAIRCAASVRSARRRRGGRRCGTSGAQGPDGGLRAG
jgi:hypothetical protein